MILEPLKSNRAAKECPERIITRSIIAHRTVKILKTRTGLRLSQHGVVISEMRLRPGPTHSLFDVLATLVAVLRPQGGVGLLGFAGGGMIAPLRALGCEAPIHAVDLDAAAFQLFKRHCRSWAGDVQWHHGEPSQWLRVQPKRSFDLIIEDLSVPHRGDVFKPDVSWGPLPKLIRERLKPDGTAIFNLLKPGNNRWNPGLAGMTAHFDAARFIQLEEFENLIVLAGTRLPAASRLGHELRKQLAALESRQAARLRISSTHASLPRRHSR